MTLKLLTEHHLEFLSLRGGFTGSYESTLVKMSYFWKTHITAHMKKKYFTDSYTALPPDIYFPQGVHPIALLGYFEV